MVARFPEHLDRSSRGLASGGMPHALAAVALALVQSAAAAPVPAPQPGVETKALAYGPLREQTLTLCKPKGTAGALPGVVLVHGGGWIAGDKAELLPLCEALARDGLFAATLDYRLARKGVATSHWPAQLADVQLAVRFLRAGGQSLGLDPERLCAYGESAGGHLAVFLAAKKTIEPSDMAARLPKQPVSVICAVDNFGPVDLANPGRGLEALTERLIGRPLTARTTAAFREASPLFSVGRDTAPIFIEQGSSDTIVRPAQSLKLFAALTNGRVPARFTVYPGGHGWQGLPPAQLRFLQREERQFLHLFLTNAPVRAGR